MKAPLVGLHDEHIPLSSCSEVCANRATHSGDVTRAPLCQNHPMLNELSNQMADAVAAVAPSVVQVQGRRRPTSGLVYGDGVVLTTAHALGRENGLKVRGHDGRALEAE